MMWLRQLLFRATTAFIFELCFCTRNNNCQQRFNNKTTATAGVTKLATSKPPEEADADTVDPYKSSSFIGHSLWMCPKGYSNQVYSDIILDVAQELGTFQFIPHITLVAAMLTGEEDVVKRARYLASQLSPYQFELDEISYRNAYFQCIYAKMKLTPDVIAANNLARQIFQERLSDPPYMPHLSLVYGDLSESDKINIVIPKIIAELDRHDSSETQFLPVDSIQVWSTQGDVKEWYLVETIPLTGTSEKTNSMDTVNTAN